MIRQYIIPYIPTSRLRRIVLKNVNAIFGKIPSGKHYKTINLNNLFDIKIDIGEYIGSELFFNKDFERDTFESIQKLMIKKKYFFDIGGNIGLISLMANYICEGEVEVHIFEPSPDNFELLKYNIILNGIDNAYLNNVAVTSQDNTKITINIYEDQAYNSVYILDRVPLKSKIEVQALSLDGYIKRNKIRGDMVELIKIDVEGYEHYVLKGASELLSKYSPKILCEISHANLSKSKLSPYDVICSLFPYGYNCYIYKNGTFCDIADYEIQELGYKYRNFVFSKDKLI